MNTTDTRRPMALITGASSGIGEAYARRLAADGFDLVLIARRASLLDALATEISGSTGAHVEVLPADLSTTSGQDPVLSRIAELESIDMLVHAAGFGTRGPFATIDPEVLAAQLTLHDVAAVRLARAVLPGMLARNNGSIIFVSSLAAFLTTAEYPGYSASKAYLNTLALGLRDELAASDVRVQSVCPGLTKTGFMDTEQYKDFDFSSVPDRYWMRPDAVVTESLHRLHKRYQPIIVPGRGNRFFLGLLQFPLLGTLLRAMMSAASRKRVRKGLPALF